MLNQIKATPPKLESVVSSFRDILYLPLTQIFLTINPVLYLLEHFLMPTERTEIRQLYYLTSKKITCTHNSSMKDETLSKEKGMREKQTACPNYETENMGKRSYNFSHQNLFQKGLKIQVCELMFIKLPKYYATMCRCTTLSMTMDKNRIAFAINTVGLN